MNRFAGIACVVAGLQGASVAQSWAQVATTGPATRLYHAMAYDTQRAKAVLFGGSGVNGAFGDTWEWSNATWTRVATTGPAARRYHAMAYDNQRGRTVLFGGIDTNSLLGGMRERTLLFA